MAEYMFFESENPYWSRQTQAQDSNRRMRAGWCCGASAVWCARSYFKTSWNVSNSLATANGGVGKRMRLHPTKATGPCLSPAGA